MEEASEALPFFPFEQSFPLIDHGCHPLEDFSVGGQSAELLLLYEEAVSLDTGIKEEEVVCEGPVGLERFDVDFHGA